MKEKIIIYQLLPRLFGNTRTGPVVGGTIEQNGCGKFADLSGQVLSSIRETGITHIWLTGIIRHASLTGYDGNGLPACHPDIVKGKAGSPYAIVDYYDTDPDLAIEVSGRMAEFEQLVERIHRNGMKVLIDFVPNHVARQYHSLNLPAGEDDLGENDDRGTCFDPDNNFYYLPGSQFRIRDFGKTGGDRYTEEPAKVTGNDVFRPDPATGDWYETVKLNYGIDYRTGRSFFEPVPATWKKMVRILEFWAAKGIDGFRCDMAGMVPVEFWHYAIGRIKSEYPGVIFIAELYEPDKYRDFLEFGYFDHLYDKEGFYNTMRRVIRGESSSMEISGIWQELEGMDNRMVRFLENHDEQRIASPGFAGNPWKALPGMAVAALMNQGPLLVYAGQEVGEPASGPSGFSGDDGRTTIFDYWVMPEFQKLYNGGRFDGGLLDEEQIRLRQAYIDLMRLAINHPVIANGQFYDLMWANADLPFRDSVYSFIRHGGSQPEEILVIAVSFDPGLNDFHIRIPAHAMGILGMETATSIEVRSLYPTKGTAERLLVSQAVSVGLTCRTGPSGFTVLSVT
jgi:glycosidase